MPDKKVQNMDEIKELVELMVSRDLVEIEIVDGENKIHLKRPQPQQTIVQGMSMMPQMMAAQPAVPHAIAAAQTSEDEGLVDIKSPIVGTMYAAASPDSEPYVKVGSDVSPDTVVCIIEAMKVMNEIKAECSGTIVKVLASNGKAIEYGQPLFKVKPN